MTPNYVWVWPFAIGKNLGKFVGPQLPYQKSQEIFGPGRHPSRPSATTSYLVPIPKPKDHYCKALSCDDFRRIAISPIISKVFEYCFLDRFQSLLSTSNKQFGFKKGLSCSNAIYTVRNITDRYIARGSTVNLCTIDLSKAFDKVNHYALYIELIKRQFPVQLLDMITAVLF